LAKGFKTIERQLRSMVTYRNPFRYFKQIPENSLQLFFADSKAWLDHPERLRSSKAFIQWAWNLKDPKKRSEIEAGEYGQHIKEFNDQGLMSTDFLTAEGLAEVEKSFRKADVNDPDNIDLSNHIIEDRTESAVHDFGQRAKGIDDALRDAYHVEDVTYKFQYYNLLRKRGLEPAEAAKRVTDYMFDFDNAPRIVKATSSVIPFKASVLWQFSRILGNKLRDSPSRTMLKIAMAAAAHTAIKETMDDEMGVTDEMREKNERGFAALYSTDIVLPMTDSRGRLIKFSSRWLIPYSDVSDFFPTSFKELRQFYRGMLPMTTQPVLTLITQTDRFGNDLVFPGTKDPDKQAEQAANVWLEVLKQSAPAMSGSYWIDMYENSQKDEPEDLINQAFLKQMAGVRAVKE